MKTICVAAAAILLSMSAANAHSFNVALLVGQSGPAASEGDQIRDGFLLATRERDSHPDEESDGHLGGLDVYFFVVEGRDDPLAGVRALLGQRTIDILAVTGPDVLVETVPPLTADGPACAGANGVYRLRRDGRHGRSAGGPGLCRGV
jgi:outer membrane PBP1 activator LpoA protein